jgi:UDP-glucose 4-epimerase
MNILVTGGAGYIGSATAEALVGAGHQVTVYDSLVTGHRAAVPANAVLIHADLADTQALSETLAKQKFDAIMHFAAFIEAGESMKEPGRFYQNNFTNTLSLMEMAVRAGVGRFVLSSTAAVFKSSEEPLSEDSPLGPTNVYGHTKLLIEQVLEWYRQIHGLHFAALRYFNACGALPNRGEAHRPESHLIPLVLRVPLGERDSANIYGTDYPTPDGTCIRDYIHVSDLANAHVLALEHIATKEESLTLNLGVGRGYSVYEVISTIEQVTGETVPRRQCDRRPGDPPVLIADSTRARESLGWEPTQALKDMVSSAWRFVRDHGVSAPGRQI